MGRRKAGEGDHGERGEWVWPTVVGVVSRAICIRLAVWSDIFEWPFLALVLCCVCV